MTDRWDRLVSRYGVAAAIAMFLVWWMASNVSGNLVDVKTILKEHVTESNFFLRAICVNAAKNEAERANCIPPQHP